MRPQLWQVSVTTTIEAEEAVSALFEDLFQEPPSVFLDAGKPAATVTAYPSRLSVSEAALRARLRSALSRVRDSGLNIAAGRITIRKLAPQDWRDSWKKHFKPLEFSRGLLVKPTWSRRRPQADQALVVLDPGLSFGTGQHPTTAFCLEQLVAARRVALEPSLLDIGTGSGILAIAAAKLGYKPVQAFDFDPVAVRVARANALQNRVAKQICIFRQDLVRLPVRRVTQFHVICANLTADLLVQQFGRIVKRLKSTGRLILSGILEMQFSQVHRTYMAAGLKLIATRRDRGWQSAVFVFRP